MRKYDFCFDTIPENLTLRGQSKGKFYYTTPTQKIVWISDRPIAEYLYHRISCSLCRRKVNRHIAYNGVGGQVHLVIDMHDADNQKTLVPPLSAIYHQALPPDATPGRPKVTKTTGTHIRARISEEDKEYLTKLGQGNLSAGLRYALMILRANRIKD